MLDNARDLTHLYDARHCGRLTLISHLMPGLDAPIFWIVIGKAVRGGDNCIQFDQCPTTQ